MFRPLPKRTYLLTAVAVAMLASPAWAEDEPKGVKAGPVVFHPGAFLESTYDTNLFYEDPDELDGGDTTAVFSLRPGVQMRAVTPSPIIANWTALFKASWQQHLSSSVRAQESSGPELNFDTRLHVWPKQTVSMAPVFLYARTKGPAGLYDQRDYDQHTLAPGITFEIAPQGGHIFSEQLGYDLLLRLYDDFSDLNSLNHHFVSNTRWNFLPQTAVTLLVEQNVKGYFTEQRSVTGPYSLDNFGSTPFRAQLGLSGLLMNRVNITLLGGYGYTFYAQGPNEHRPLARVDLGYDWSAGTKLSLGYTHNFEDSTFGNYFTYHRVHALFRTLINNRVRGDISARVNILDFAPIETSADQGYQRSDVVYDVVTTIAYTFTPGFSLSGTYTARGNQSNFRVNFSDGTTATGSYLKHELTFLLDYEY